MSYKLSTYLLATLLVLIFAPLLFVGISMARAGNRYITYNIFAYQLPYVRFPGQTLHTVSVGEITDTDLLGHCYDANLGLPVEAGQIYTSEDGTERAASCILTLDDERIEFLAYPEDSLCRDKYPRRVAVEYNAQKNICEETVYSPWMLGL